MHTQTFEKYNAVLRGLQSTSDFLRNTLVRLCCSKIKAEQYQGNAKIFEPANGEIKFEQAKAAVNKYTTTLQCARRTLAHLHTAQLPTHTHDMQRQLTQHTQDGIPRGMCICMCMCTCACMLMR